MQWLDSSHVFENFKHGAYLVSIFLEIKSRCSSIKWYSIVSGGINFKKSTAIFIAFFLIWPWFVDNNQCLNSNLNSQISLLNAKKYYNYQF